MMTKNVEEKQEYISHLEDRQQELKIKIDSNWMMRTPERVENLPSPPYIITKNEDDELEYNQISNHQINSRIPDNSFKISTKDCRTGSKKQDLRASRHPGRLAGGRGRLHGEDEEDQQQKTIHLRIREQLVQQQVGAGDRTGDTAGH